jgi:hypothetical protein
MGYGGRALLRALKLIALCGLLAAFVSHDLCAHNPDTSYARVEITPSGVTLKLTYDLFTLSKIVALDEDVDRRITREELQKHAPEIRDFLSRHIGLEISGATPGLGQMKEVVWPKDAEEGVAEKDFHSVAALVSFMFERPLEDLPEDVTLTFRFFSRFGDRHTVVGKFVYCGKETEVTFNQFEADYLFDTGYEPPLLKRVLKFGRLGMEHIFFGFDHLCFLFALIMVAGVREMVKVITSFTIAHSITLILSVMQIVRLPSRFVEAAVAATIVYVALENLRAHPPRHRWRLTFGFGLIHGFAFASVLETLALPSEGLVRCLLSFNMGVELGQVAIVVLLFPCVMLLQRWRHRERAIRFASGVLAVVGLVWFINRVI